MFGGCFFRDEEFELVSIVGNCIVVGLCGLFDCVGVNGEV